MAADDAMA